MQLFIVLIGLLYTSCYPCLTNAQFVPCLKYLQYACFNSHKLLYTPRLCLKVCINMYQEL